MIRKLRKIKCPKCGETLIIPIFWVVGIEGIFYCKTCKQNMKIDYRLGALLMGVSWALSFASIQLLAIFTSALTVTIAILAFIPLAFFYSFILRRTVLLIRCKTKSKAANKS